MTVEKGNIGGAGGPEDKIYYLCNIDRDSWLSKQMNYTTETFETNKLPKDIRTDIDFLFEEIYKLKKDALWENYQSYDYDSNLYTSVQYNEHGRLDLVSGIHTRDFYPSDTYRVFNRLARNPNARLGGAKTNNGSQPSHVMLEQQIETVKNQLNGEFYFLVDSTKMIAG